MCGIAGVLPAKGRADHTGLLLDMAGELLHRGPDGVGLYVDGNFGMVATRLAIIDVAGGQPPISNETGRYWVIQNGEIYNFPELMEELRALGHRFTTRCDTEVLVHAFEQWGSDCLHRLNGAFAFAIWDRARQELFLARDRFGIRPLFIAELGGDFVFGSEAKAILRHPQARRALDPRCLADAFTSWSTLPDHSAFEGIRELAPGHYLRCRAGQIGDPVRWWDLPFGVMGEPDRSADAWAEELLDLLADATRIRLRADVPVGVYLSGGLDSSTTTALARRYTTSSLHAFGIGFADGRFDESAEQDGFAKHLGVDLVRVMARNQDIATGLPDVVALAERPLLRTAPGPLLALSQTVRNSGLKVVLTGEGADELLAGYNIFREVKVRRFWARQPDSTLRPRLLRRLYPYVVPSGSAATAFLEHFFRQGLTDVTDPLYSHRIRFNNTARCMRFFGDEVRLEADKRGTYEDRLLERLPPDFDRWGALDKAQYLEVSTFLEGYLLHAQGDRMLMGNSVEGRFPFLDHRLAELAARVPERLRIRGLTEKYLLRRATADLLPPEVRFRPKQPYRAPIAGVLAGPAAPCYVQELTSAESLKRAGIFAPEAVKRLFRKAGDPERSLGETDEMALIGIVSTMLLHDRYVARPVLASRPEATRIVVGEPEGNASEVVLAEGAQHGA